MTSFRIVGYPSTTALSTPPLLTSNGVPVKRLPDLQAKQLLPLPPSFLGVTPPAKPPKPRRPFVQAFIDLILPSAKKVELSWGIPISITVGQAAFETGWGKSVVGNAYFGIKGKAPGGDSVTFATHEENSSGDRIAVEDKFRAYASIDEAADDYGRVLNTTPRFARVMLYTSDVYKMADMLQIVGYATDHQYAAKLKSIIKSNDLQLLDAPNLLFAPDFLYALQTPPGR